jgi:Protein of unknown function (DUF3300)
MNKRRMMFEFFRCILAVICVALLVLGQPGLLVEGPAKAAPQAQSDSNAPIPPDQLDSLIAPIALYPDPLLAQVLAASTYPLELVQLQQWLAQHKDLKDKALADAVQKQNWDASVQGLAGLPDVVKFLTDDITWTTDLGNAFLAQQSDVMDAVQRMRAKAQSKGSLKSSDQIKVESQKVDNKQVIVIEQANPQVIYVPSYNPTVVYGAPPYPYPPIAYPPPGYYAAGMALSFGVGVAMGAMWSGGWGYNTGWHGGNNNIVINNNNNYVRNSNINNRNVNSVNRNGNTWQHNPQHRGGTPYANQATASRFGGTTAGSSRSQRQQTARQNMGQQRSNGQQLGGQNRSAAGGQLSGQNRQAGGGQLGSGNRSTAQASGDRIGNRSVPSGGGQAKGGGGFGGGGNLSGGSARASSSRGASSMGGGARAGGGRRR